MCLFFVFFVLCVVDGSAQRASGLASAQRCPAFIPTAALKYGVTLHHVSHDGFHYYITEQSSPSDFRSRLNAHALTQTHLHEPRLRGKIIFSETITHF